MVERWCGITRPREFIQGERRVAGMGEGGEEWLAGYKAEVQRVLGELQAVMQAAKQERSNCAA